MTTRRRTIRPAAALAVPLLALALAGCAGLPVAPPASSGGPGSTDSTTSAPDAGGAEGQTVAQACDTLAAGMQELGQVDASNIQDDLVNDPEAALATIDAAESAILDATDAITNDEIRPYAEKAADATRTYFGIVRDAAEDPSGADYDGIQADLSEFTAAIVELQTACAAG
ncbi:hypothetical protein ACFPER_08005 [Agromyces aurantiacus]|uniref:Lipoprotein n=1 Tax=Agromyces aurantiacus TaxID=165814 RepID=A0ABV9R437_9MICO|nr:hypothetical protein [Agromyces aurantiacus]MBM7503409.1 hypothetical protein [Agromyces aurantiacus]